MRQAIKYLFVNIFAGMACFSCPTLIIAQAGGNNTWEFLNITNSARVASLGGKNISIRDNDLSMVFHNPALLDSSMNNQLVVNYVNYFTDINIGYASWSYHHNKYGSFAAGIHYINYGNFTASEPTGIITGQFTASEQSLNLTWSMPIDTLFSAGATIKGIYSSFEQYSSSGIALDAGINYYNSSHMFSASFVVKNLGTQISTYYRGGSREPLPFELQLGATKQLSHAPFRFSVLYQHLQDFNLNTEKSTVTEEDSPSMSENLGKLGSELIRHMVIGVEFIPVSSFSVHLGYNNLRRHELKIEERVSTVGFSWGFGVRVNRFRINLGQARYHLGGSSSHFSLSTNLSYFYRNQPF